MAGSFLASADSLLRLRPLVVGTLTGSPAWRSSLSVAARSSLDVLEVRFDTFAEAYLPIERATRALKELLLAAKKVVRAPVLLTIRSADERGERRPQPISRRIPIRGRW